MSAVPVSASRPFISLILLISSPTPSMSPGDCRYGYFNSHSNCHGSDISCVTDSNGRQSSTARWVLEGLNPSQYSASNPIILFIIRVFGPILSNVQHLFLEERADYVFNRLASLLSSAACSTSPSPSSASLG